MTTLLQGRFSRMREMVRQKAGIALPGSSGDITPTANQRCAKMFEEATLFHTRLNTCHKYAIMQRDGAAGFFAAAHQALTANAPQLWDLDHETGHPTAIGTAYGPPPGEANSSTAGLVELNTIASRLVSRMDEEVILPMDKWQKEYATMKIKLDKLETLRLDFDSSRRRYTDLENRLSGTTKPDLATELQNKLSTKDSKVQGKRSNYMSHEQQLHAELSALLQNSTQLWGQIAATLGIMAEGLGAAHNQLQRTPPPAGLPPAAPAYPTPLDQGLYKNQYGQVPATHFDPQFAAHRHPAQMSPAEQEEFYQEQARRREQRTQHVHHYHNDGPPPPSQRPPQQAPPPSSPFDEGTGGLNRGSNQPPNQPPPNYNSPPSSNYPPPQYDGPSGSAPSQFGVQGPPQREASRPEQPGSSYTPPGSSGINRPDIPEWGPGPAGVQEPRRPTSDYPQTGTSNGGPQGSNPEREYTNSSGPGQGGYGGSQSNHPNMYPTVSR